MICVYCVIDRSHCALIYFVHFKNNSLWCLNLFTLLSGMTICLKGKPASLFITPIRIAAVIILLIIITVKISLLFHKHVLAPTPMTPHPGLLLNRAQSQTNSQTLLNLLHEELFETANTTSCDNFRKCAVKRKKALVQGCLQEGHDRFSGQFSGPHSTRYYFTYNLESCSGNEENLLDSLTFEVPTVQIVNTESTNTRILHMDNPLLRLYEYYQTLRSGIGYLYLGEEIVYKYRHFNLSEAWKLPYIYEARLGLLWDSSGSKNPFGNPFGPTFLEFMVYLADLNTIKPKNIAPTVLNCRACDTDYDIIVRNQNELRCFDNLFPPESLTDNLSHEAKSEIYQSFHNLPEWVLAHVYDMYASDLNTFQC